MVVTPELRAGLALPAWAQQQWVPFLRLPQPLCSSCTPFLGTVCESPRSYWNGAQTPEAASVSGLLCPVPPSEGPSACPMCRWPEAPSLGALRLPHGSVPPDPSAHGHSGHTCDLGSGEERCDQDRGRVPERGAGKWRLDFPGAKREASLVPHRNRRKTPHVALQLEKNHEIRPSL